MLWGGRPGKAASFMKDLKAARELANRAVLDLAALEEIAGNPRVADEIFGSLAQQAVEKSMKAWLAILGRQYPLTHKLQQLSRELEDAGVKVSEYGDFDFLNPFAVQFRYQTMDDTEPSLDRDAILGKVKHLAGKIQALVEKAWEKEPGVEETPAVYRTDRPKKKRLRKGKQP